jgi:FRG domain
MKPETIVTSIAELVDAVRQHRTDRRDVVWFRGHGSRTWRVAPAIWRDYDKQHERNFTNRFRSRAATRMTTVPLYDDSAIWLSLMQHYGLPTRLLDWSRSPLVAAYFALERYIYDKNSKPEDASIWMLRPHALNVAEGFENITPPIDAYTVTRMLTPAFTHRDPENNKVIAVMAAERDMRMFVQQGCFTVHSSTKPLDGRKEANKYLTEVRIPATNVLNMADEIDLCGFRKGDLFPDLGHLAEELKGIYPPP